MSTAFSSAQSTVNSNGNRLAHRTLQILSWNTCGLQSGGIDIIASQLDVNATIWDAILLQEGPTNPETHVCTLESGHIWCVAASGTSRCVSILLHKRWSSTEFSFTCFDYRTAYLDLNILDVQLRLISCHLPDSASYSDSDYGHALQSLEAVCKQAKDRICIVGVDANAILGEQGEHDNSIVVGSHGLGTRNHRGHLFSHFLHTSRMAACNTMFCKRPDCVWTHQLWSTHAQRQIDFLLLDCSHSHNVLDTFIVHDIFEKTDHRCIGVRIKLFGSKRQRRARGPRAGGWTPLLDNQGKPASFHHAVRNNLQSASHLTPDVISSCIVAAAGEASCYKSTPRKRHSDAITASIQERRVCQDKEERKRLSKHIFYLLKIEAKQKINSKLDCMIMHGQTRQKLASILNHGRRSNRIQSVYALDGSLCSSQIGIANAFADFYESLYSHLEALSLERPATGSLEPVTLSEIKIACKLLKARRSCAEDGLVAEMLKVGDSYMFEVLACVFTDLLQSKLLIPESWRTSRLTILFKKGCCKSLGNYRPIAVVPVLYKLFATVLLKRIQVKLDTLQPEEQTGFRATYSCSDVVHALRQVAEKSADWGLNVWIASLDLEKAFDKLYHANVDLALRDAGVDPFIIRWLMELYSDQSSFVQLGSTRSRLFKICRGVRQGDPLSPLLFINVMRVLVSRLKEEWERKGFGISVGARADIDKLCLLSFADDTTLLAGSRQSLVSMLKQLRIVFSQAGLKLNADKCIVMTNTNVRKSTLKVGDMEFPIVPADRGFKILGTQYCLFGRTCIELKQRISFAWGRFHKIWHLLSCRRADLGKRLRIFDSDVRQSLLWCCESWNLTVEEMNMLTVTERCMLRRFASPKRRSNEDYLAWVVRATRDVEDALAKANLAPCAHVYLQRKWIWAGKLMRMQNSRWAKRVTTWRDNEWWSRQPRDCLRPVRRCRKYWFRWEDSLRKFSEHLGWQHWQQLANETTEQQWEQHTVGFCNFIYRKFDL